METWNTYFYKEPLLIFKEVYNKEENKLFSRASCNRKRVIGFQLQEGQFILDVGRTWSAMRVVNHWHRLPQGVMEAPSQERFQVRLDEDLNNLV